MADKHLPLPAHPASYQIPFSRPATPQAQPLQIGIYGLGNIGYLMARNLAVYKASSPVPSLPLLVYNRTVSKSEDLVKEAGKANVHIAQNVSQLVTECDVIITNLASDAVVKSVYMEFSKALTVRITWLGWTLDRVLILVFDLEAITSGEEQDLCRN